MFQPAFGAQESLTFNNAITEEAQLLETQNYEKCFASEKLQEYDDNPDVEDLEDIKGAAATIFGAGADTVCLRHRSFMYRSEMLILKSLHGTQTYATLMVFCLAMILHPECQKRAYEEIISVVGKKTLPDLSNRESLPYVECIVQKVLRYVFHRDSARSGVLLTD
ncbi:hypothetical protein AAF712_008606 [Marasmius tenuissimus]|uniref:Cytochrome P450 n=1 Tax=Marasmius tenuissimus TaxID=585030 RepID=A0ABR2ZRY4_9AGAR